MKYKFNIKGMHCSACSSSVERVVRKIKGVNKAEVSLTLEMLTVESNTNLSSDIITAVKKAGFTATPFKTQNVSEVKSSKTKLILSIVTLLLLMYVAMHEMLNLPFFKILSKQGNVVLFVLAQLILTIIVIALNFKFFIRGVKAVLHGSPDMDTLISLGSSAAFLYGLYTFILICVSAKNGNGESSVKLASNLYFESSAMILTLVSVGKYLEGLARKKTESAALSLKKLAPKTATVIENGIEKNVLIENIKVGDILLIKEGETLALDGTILNGKIEVDESSLTGESMPILKEQSSQVKAGTTCVSGYAQISVTAVNEDTEISKIIDYLLSAEASKAPVQRLADKISGIFVPTVIAISIITFIIWILISKSFSVSINYAISVLVISCPCALGLATPVAITASMGRCAKKGILIKSAEVLENIGNIKTALFDKTGTLTEGTPQVESVFNLSESELIKIASIENMSSHPLSTAVTNYVESKNYFEVLNFNSVTGEGVFGNIDNDSYIIGNLKAVKNSKISKKIESGSQNSINSGKTVLFVSKNGVVIGFIEVVDKIKNSSITAIKGLKELGVKTVIVSGDNEKVVNLTKEKLNLDEAFSEVYPTKKAEIVKSYGDNTMFIGDGVNDSPALTVATVGVTVASGTDIALNSSQVILLNNNLENTVSAIKIGKKTRRIIKQNLFWAFFYNVIGIPIAMGALSFIGIVLSPMLASAFMSVSSIFVVTNALRLQKL